MHNTTLNQIAQSIEYIDCESEESVIYLTDLIDESLNFKVKDSTLSDNITDSLEDLLYLLESMTSFKSYQVEYIKDCALKLVQSLTIL